MGRLGSIVDACRAIRCSSVRVVFVLIPCAECDPRTSALKLQASGYLP